MSRAAYVSVVFRSFILNSQKFRSKLFMGGFLRSLNTNTVLANALDAPGVQGDTRRRRLRSFFKIHKNMTSTNAQGQPSAQGGTIGRRFQEFLLNPQNFRSKLCTGGF